MFGLGKKTDVATGCGTCRVKSEGNCTSHLTGAISIIAQGFIDAKVAFNPANTDHMQIVSGILAEDIRDDKDRHVVYDLPSEPKLRDWFISNIQQRVKAAGIQNG